MTQSIWQERDRKFINLAINLVRKNFQKTAPNPRVATIIVKDENILATSVTAIGGRPHSEIIAINKIHDKNILKGSTIYLTLEPCCQYHGKISEPCVDEIIKYKFARVVIACLDYNPNIKGRSVEILRKAGIDVVVLNDENAREFYQEFQKVQEVKIPFVTLKIATSFDGKIATKDFSSKWITNPRSRQYAHFLRANCDAILIGKNTLIKDNPKLDCRIAGLEQYSPRKIIISQSLDFLENLLNFQISQNNFELIILTGYSNQGQDSLQDLLKKFPKNFSIKIIYCEEFVDKDRITKIKFLDALKKLTNENVNSILIEGGGKIITQFLQEDLIDKIVWARSNMIIGSDGISAIQELNFSDINQCIQKFKRIETLDFGSDIIEILQK